MPKKRHGFRKLVVGNLPYSYRICSSGIVFYDSQDKKHLISIYMDEHTALTPGSVADEIRDCMQKNLFNLSKN